MNLKQTKTRYPQNANNKNYVIDLLLKLKNTSLWVILLFLTQSLLFAQSYGAGTGTKYDTYVINNDNSNDRAVLRLQDPNSAWLLEHGTDRLEFKWANNKNHSNYGLFRMGIDSNGNLDTYGKIKAGKGINSLDHISLRAGTGKGFRFWDNDKFKLHMGRGSEYKYGPVTDYAIKMNMSDTSTYGWVWGVHNQTPIAALNTQGNMKLAGTLDVAGLTINGKTLEVNDGAEANFGQIELHGRYSDFNTYVTQWGWNYVNSNKNGPNNLSSKWYRHISSLGKEYNINQYRIEIAYPRFNQSNAGVWMRTLENGWLKPWTKISGGNVNTDNLTVTSLTVGTDKKINGAIAHFDGRVYISEENGTEEGFGSTTEDNYKDYLLWVEEGIVSSDFALAELTEWPDYVFYNDYKLPSLATVEKNIKENGHLHTMPSAKEVEENGFTVKDMTKRVVKTIEELTLHTIAQEKQIEAQNKLIEKLSKRLEKLEQANK